MIEFEVMDLEEFYDLDIEQQKKYVENVKKAIEKSDSKILKKMHNIVKRDVKSFMSDFYIHDLYLIKKYKGPFIWMTRPTGTDLFPLCNLYKYTMIVEFYNYVKYVNRNFYYYDGNYLKKIEFNKMEEIIQKNLKTI